MRQFYGKFYHRISYERNEFTVKNTEEVSQRNNEFVNFYTCTNKYRIFCKIKWKQIIDYYFKY